MAPGSKTSLLIAATDGDRLAEALSSRGIAWAEIGVIGEGKPGAVVVTGLLAG